MAPAGIQRHAALVAALIEAGELVQGVTDTQFQAIGGDDRSPANTAAIALLTRIAVAVRVSWESGCAQLG